MNDPMPFAKTERRITRRGLTRGALRWIERGFALFGALIAIFWLTADISIIVSPSMQPTLQGSSVDKGDRLVTEKVSRWFRAHRRWDVVTYITPAGEKRSKRIVGLPGEEVQMPTARGLRIDGRTIELPAVLAHQYLRFGNLADGNPVACGDGYYVLGDDLKDSDDSRFNGPVADRHIIGRAWLIVWPRERIGLVR